MFFAYVLLSEKDGNRYYGVTNNLVRRLSEHNSGKVRSTKVRRPLKIVYFEKFTNFDQAGARELYFKSGSGREFVKRKLIVAPSSSGLG